MISKEEITVDVCNFVFISIKVQTHCPGHTIQLSALFRTVRWLLVRQKRM